MTTPMPEQRRALRRSADRELHPVTPPPGDALPAQPARREAPAGAPARKDKQVKLSVRMPKSLRAALREEAERRGMSVDELVVILLGDRITR